MRRELRNVSKIDRKMVPGCQKATFCRLDNARGDWPRAGAILTEQWRLRTVYGEYFQEHHEFGGEEGS